MHALNIKHIQTYKQHEQTICKKEKHKISHIQHAMNTYIVNIIINCIYSTAKEETRTQETKAMSVKRVRKTEELMHTYDNHSRIL